MNKAKIVTMVAPKKYGLKNLVKEMLAALIAIISVFFESLEVKKITEIKSANGMKVLAK
jgi:hypothetical protein